MACWQRKLGKYVSVYYYKAGKKKALPRSETKHLDAEPDSNVETWVTNWELTHEAQGQPRDVLTDTAMLGLLDSYITFLKSRGKAKGTIGWHRQLLNQYVLPFFVHQEPMLRDPQQWPGKSIRLYEYLQEKKASDATVMRSNASLRGFWNWMSDEGHVMNGLALRLRRPVVEAKGTPLKFTLEPKQVIEFARTSTDPSLRLMALLGYFFSLRPYEVFALTKVDFRAGKMVEELGCSKAMKKHALFHKLVANISKQRDKEGIVKAPKAYSKGWVACFNEEAAKLIVLAIKDKGDEFLFPLLPDAYFVKWRNGGIKDITMKDLRRASLYWLGHEKAFDLVALKNHARHSRVETTMLYLRRPNEELEEFQSLDLDA